MLQGQKFTFDSFPLTILIPKEAIQPGTSDLEKTAPPGELEIVSRLN